MTAQYDRWVQSVNLIGHCIPRQWLVEVGDATFVTPDRLREPVVRLHQALLTIGWAMGWSVDPGDLEESLKLARSVAR